MLARSVIAAASLILLSIPANAWSDLERMTLSSALGKVLASERVCGMSYKPDAIRKFIDSKVPADDLQFLGMLELGVSGTEYTLKEMSESTKVAHCRQIERVAKAYGFI